MNKNKTLFIIALVFVLLLGGAYVLYGKLAQGTAPDQLSVQGGMDGQTTQPSEELQKDTDSSGDESTEPEKVLVPDFAVYDSEGNEVHLSDFIGKPIVLNFWASWCGPCKMEMPDFDDAYAELGEDVHFLMVNMTSGRETLESATAFIEEQGYSFPVYYDTDGDAAMTYGVYSLPTTLFIDAEGYGIAQATGAINAETLQRGIDMILRA